MARTYKRDSKGRFAGGGGGSSGGSGKKRSGAKPKADTPAWQRAERTANWIRKPGEGWVRNNPSNAKPKPRTAWERAERTANWVRKNGEWVRNR